MAPDYHTKDYRSRRSPVFSTEGITASSQSLASEVGLAILRAGGNAADSAIAMAAALNVTEPCNCGIGGDVFALYFEARTKKVHAINGSGKSPQALSLAKARELGITGHTIKHTNVNSATVPGAAAAWVDIHEQWGSKKLTMKQILQPAIDLANKGFPVGCQAAAEWIKSEELLRTASPASSAFLHDGKAPRAGQIFSNPGLASTFEELAEKGKAGFYEGRVAQAIVDVVQSLGGVMTLEDLASHKSDFVEPISYTYGKEQNTVWECPPNGQGLAALIALGILDTLQEEGTIDLDSHAEGGAEWLHALIEAIRLAFADVHAFVGDPAFSRVPVEEMLSKPYLQARAKLFNPNAATAIYEQGRPLDFSDTVYFATSDSEGNSMSFIMSNYFGYGTGVVPEGCGFTLQNRGSGFFLTEEGPNRLEGGKRPYHTIVPALCTRGSELFCSFGIMGGNQQPQAHVQVLLNLLHHRHHSQSALDAPRFCVGGPYPSRDGVGAEAWYNKVVCIEEGIKQDVVDRLRGLGHHIEVVGGAKRILFGKGQLILAQTDERTGRRVWVGGSDPRGDGCALPLLL